MALNELCSLEQSRLLLIAASRVSLQCVVMGRWLGAAHSKQFAVDSL